MPAGGARKGAGRKPLSEELKTADLCRSAIINHFGSLEKGLIYLITSQEPALMKFVFEHAYGKPTDKVEQSGGIEIKAYWDKSLIPSDTDVPPQE